MGGGKFIVIRGFRLITYWYKLSDIDVYAIKEKDEKWKFQFQVLYTVP